MSAPQPVETASPRAPAAKVLLATRAAHEELVLAMRWRGLDCAAQAYLLADLRARVEADPHGSYVDALRMDRHGLASAVLSPRCA